MTVSLATAQARANGRVTVALAVRPENVLAQGVVGTPENPNPGPGTGPGEAQTTVRTWLVRSNDRARLAIEVPELAGDTDPAIEARLVAAGNTCRAQATTVPDGARGGVL